MIEFKASYFKTKCDKKISVLVQFDGSSLHIWHLSDPFYRIVTSDVFIISPNTYEGKGIIKLTNNDHIETDDLQGIILLKRSAEKYQQKRRLKALSVTAIIFVVSILLLFFGVLLISKAF